MTFAKSVIAWSALPAVAILMFAAACGGGSSSSSSNNSGGSTSTLATSCPSGATNCATLTVNAGPAIVDNESYINGAFTTVMVCQPGSTSTCATVGGVLVDTGSVGLRLLKSAITSASLPTANSGGGALVECYPFVSTYMWGPVATADITVGGETASSAPVMIVDDSTTPAYTAPESCYDYDGSAPNSANSLDALGANGILGIGSTPEDCGNYCAQSPASQVDTSGDFTGFYYSCTSASNCAGTAVATTAQVPNPVSRFTTDNNGTAIALPSVSATGTASTVTGALYFGIGTQSNNSMPSRVSLLQLDTDYEQYITTTFNKVSYPESYIDSGSNGYFFVDSTLKVCSDYSDWFCPSSTTSLSATTSGWNGNSNSVSFSVASADTIFDGNSGNNIAASGLAAPLDSSSNTFDWGLPFFYGRTVYNAIYGSSVTDSSSTVYNGAFVAY